MNFLSRPIDTTTSPVVMAPTDRQHNDLTSGVGATAVASTLLLNCMGINTFCSDRTEKQLIICDPDLRVLHPTGEVLQGTLNYISLFSDQNKNLYTWRIPKKYPEILPQIHKDLIGTGFLTSGGRYKYRTLQEQVNFMARAGKANLQSLMPVYADKFGILSPFIQGTPYDQYLRSGGITATKSVLDNILAAHAQGIVYGDRWTKNTIVKPDETIVEIDFDIELMAENAQEFEMAQLLYHILFFSSRRNEMLIFLNDYLQTHKRALSQHNISVIKDFLFNYINYFADKPVEGILGGVKQEVAELTNMLSKQYSTTCA